MQGTVLIEALVETKADAEGKVKIYYVLGDHGWCSNADWSSCLYRMACIKCPFFVPKEQAQLIEARTTMKRFLEVVNLTPEEVTAVQEDLGKLDETIAIKGSATPNSASSESQRGIPAWYSSSRSQCGKGDDRKLICQFTLKLVVRPKSDTLFSRKVSHLGQCLNTHGVWSSGT